MTDITTPIGLEPRLGVHTDDAAKARLKGRYGAEARFKWLGAGAVALSAVFLVLLLSTIVTEAIPAFRMNYVTLPVDLSPAKVDPANLGATNFASLAQDALSAKFPGVESRQDRRLLRGLISTGAGDILRRQIAEDPSLLGKTVDYPFPLDDFADLYLKGLIAEKSSDTVIATTVAPSGATGDIDVTFGDDSIARLARGYGATEDNGVLRLTSGASSMLVRVDGGVVKLTEISTPGTKSMPTRFAAADASSRPSTVS